MEIYLVSMTMQREARHGLRNAEQYPTPIGVRHWRFKVVCSIGPGFSLIMQTSLCIGSCPFRIAACSVSA